MRRYVFMIARAACVLLLAACQPATALPVSTQMPEPNGTAASPASPTTSPAQTPIPVTGETASPSPAEQMTQLSIAALSQQLGIPEVDIKVLEVTPMTWPDASLGCPKRGVLYIQVITPGFQIRLEANGQVYVFHTDETKLVVPCQQPAE